VSSAPAQPRHVTIGTAIAATLALAACIATFIGAEAYRLDGRIFPRLVAVVGGLAAAIILFRALLELGRPKAATSAPVQSDLTLSDHLVAYLGPAFYGLMIYVVGFWAASAICLAGLLAFLGERRWLLIGAITVGTLLSIYVIFTFAFSIRMPEGLLLEWWNS